MPWAPTCRRVAAVSLLLAATCLRPAGAGELPPPLLQETPLVLKDGRMAYVTVQPVPFDAGADAPAQATAEALSKLASDTATDCFLTAQAIGHVAPGTKGEGDSTLAAHRLARARAEHVQRVLAEHGLPSNLVASVWDWQFLVREPRVTLWIFNLREGEDCQGKPLPTPDRAAVAKADPVGGPAKVANAGEAAPPPTATVPLKAAKRPTIVASSAFAPPDDAGAPPPSDTAAVEPPPATTEAPAKAAAPKEQVADAGTAPPPESAEKAPPKAAVADAGTAKAPAPPKKAKVAPVREAHAAKRSTPAAAPAPTIAVAQLPPVPDAPRSAADGEPHQVEAAEQPPAALASASADELPAPAAGADAPPADPATPTPPQAKPTRADGQHFELTFDNNSSYLPDGAGAELRRWLGTLPAGKGYTIRVTAAVNGVGKDSAATAQGRYDRWIAERRANRVAQWLEKNAQVRKLKMAQGYAENDGSRRVVLEAHPIP